MRKPTQDAVDAGRELLAAENGDPKDLEQPEGGDALEGKSGKKGNRRKASWRARKGVISNREATRFNPPSDLRGRVGEKRRKTRWRRLKAGEFPEQGPHTLKRSLSCWIQQARGGYINSTQALKDIIDNERGLTAKEFTTFFEGGNFELALQEAA